MRPPPFLRKTSFWDKHGAMIPSDPDENAATVHPGDDRAPQRDVCERIAERCRLAAATGPQPRDERRSIDHRLERSEPGHAPTHEYRVEPDGKEVCGQRIPPERDE